MNQERIFEVAFQEDSRGIFCVINDYRAIPHDKTWICEQPAPGEVWRVEVVSVIVGSNILLLMPLERLSCG